MTEKVPIERRSSNIPDDIDTDDLEAEVARRKAAQYGERQNRVVIGGAIAAALTAWIPSVANFIDAQTDKTRQEALVTKVSQEKVSNDSAYAELADALNQHSDRLQELQRCESDLDALKEWRKSVDEKLRQRFNVRFPADAKLTRVNSARAEEDAPKVSPTRPQAAQSDPQVQQLREELLK